MKKIILALFITANLSAAASNSGELTKTGKNLSDTTVLPQILALPLSSFIGKPVDSLLSVLPLPYTDRNFIPARAGFCRGVYQVYGDDEVNTVSVSIFIDHFQFMPFPNLSPTTMWNMNLAKQETISFIRVVKSNTICVFGCNNTRYE